MSSPSASVIGNRFVFEYYTTLNKNPNKLFQFYKEESTYTHGIEGVTTDDDQVNGTELIDKKIRSLKCNDCKVTLSVVDCQESWNRAIMILVIGHIANKGENPQKFVQNFCLAPQTKPEVGYFVQNSIFRYLDEKSFEVSLEKHNNTPSAPPVDILPPENPELQESAPTSVIPPTVTHPSIPEIPQVPQISTANETPKAKTSQISNQKEGKPSKKQNETSEPHSWARLVTQPGSAPATPSTAPSATSPTVTPSVASASPQESPQTTPKGRGGQRVLDGRSLYVSNVPFTATQTQLQKIFSQFGQIVEVALQKGYCFVEFTKVEAVQEALKAPSSVFILEDRQLSVEERKPKPSTRRKEYPKDRNRGRGVRPERTNSGHDRV